MKATTQFRLVPFHLLKIEDGFNVRKDYGDLTALKESISEAGLWSPLKVRSDSKGKWLIIDGHRRYRALQLIQQEGYEFPGVEVIVEQEGVTERERTLQLLLLNDGKPLTMSEQAEVYKRLEQMGMSTGEIAAQAGKSGQHIRDCKLYDTATPTTKKLVSDGKISASNIITLLRSEDSPDIVEEKVLDMITGVKDRQARSKKDSAGVGTMRDRMNECYSLLVATDTTLRYSESDLLKVLQYVEEGYGNIGKLLEGSAK